MTDRTPAALQVAEQHAKALERYARACPAYEDGGPGIEESLHAGADALRALTALQSEIAALPAPRGTLVQATVLNLIDRKLKGGPDATR